MGPSPGPASSSCYVPRDAMDRKTYGISRSQRTVGRRRERDPFRRDFPVGIRGRCTPRWSRCPLPCLSRRNSGGNCTDFEISFLDHESFGFEKKVFEPIRPERTKTFCTGSIHPPRRLNLSSSSARGPKTPFRVSRPGKKGDIDRRGSDGSHPPNGPQTRWVRRPWVPGCEGPLVDRWWTESPRGPRTDRRGRSIHRTRRGHHRRIPLFLDDDRSTDAMGAFRMGVASRRGRVCESPHILDRNGTDSNRGFEGHWKGYVVSTHVLFASSRTRTRTSYTRNGKKHLTHGA